MPASDAFRELHELRLKKVEKKHQIVLTHCATLGRPPISQPNEKSTLFFTALG